MSAYHEYQYRQQQRREQYLNRVRSNTQRFLVRYEEVMRDMHSQGLDQVVSTEYKQLSQEINRLKFLLDSDPEEARNFSISLGDEVYGLRRLANQARKQIRSEDRQLIIEKELLHKEKSKNLWNKLKSEFHDPVVRDFAFDDILKLKDIFETLSENEVKKRIRKIKSEAQQKAETWKSEKAKSLISETQLEIIEEQKKNVILDLKDNPKQMQKILDNLQSNHAFLKRGESITNDTFNKTISDSICKADELVTDERCRQMTVRGIIETLKQQGFQLTGSPQLFRDENRDEVVIQAKRLSGRSSLFKVSLDGAFSYKFENYEGMACKDDIEEIIPKLQEIYGIKLSDKQVIWENPDRNLRSAKSIEDPQESNNDR